jgi:phosphosulfolactate synthase
MQFLNLPDRTKKERSFGITSIVDFGVPIGELENILNDYHQFIDIAKIGVGSAYVTPNLERKLEIYKHFDIKAYCGGTLFEKFYYQNKVDDYLKYKSQLGIEWIEVSTGILDIPLEKRLSLVAQFKKHFNVIGEVGSKDAQKDMPVKVWNEEIKALLEAGCQYVITEGRDSGTSGIYESNGQLKTELVQDVINQVDHRKIIFEAPTPKSQMYFINSLGANVNLGNVKINQVLLLETQRSGLRTETFYMGEHQCN